MPQFSQATKTNRCDVSSYALHVSLWVHCRFNLVWVTSSDRCEVTPKISFEQQFGVKHEGCLFFYTTLLLFFVLCSRLGAASLRCYLQQRLLQSETECSLNRSELWERCTDSTAPLSQNKYIVDVFFSFFFSYTAKAAPISF